jgi:hypothetical protein
MLIHVPCAKANDTFFSGFANIGLSYSNSDLLEYRSSIINNSHTGFSLAPDSILGLHVNTSFSDNVDAVGQIILQDRSNHAATNYIEIAFLRYQFNRNTAVKLGRFSINSYLFTDFRYVGQATTWVRPPLEMYSTIGALGHMDGIQGTYIFSTYFGSINFGAAYGVSELRNSRGINMFKLKYDNFVALNTEVQGTNWRIQAAYLSSNLQEAEFAGAEEIANGSSAFPDILVPYSEQIISRILVKSQDVSYFTLGGHYTKDNYEFIGEIAKYNSDFIYSTSSKFAYVTVSKHIDSVTPFITLAINRREQPAEIIDYGAAKAELSEPLYQQLVLLSQSTNEIARNASVDQQSLSVGLKWDISSEWAIKLQLDHYRTNETGSGLFVVIPGIPTPEQKQILNVSSINFSTTF